MSAPEQPTQPPRVAPEGLSSVALTTNAKGGVVQIAVKVYAESNDETDIQRAQSEAERIFDAECAKYGVQIPETAGAS